MPEKKPEDISSEPEAEVVRVISDEQEEETVGTESGDISRKLMMFSGRAASVFVVGALVFTIGVMYKKGQLDHLATEMKEVVANIMNKGDTSELDNVVLLDENKKTKTEQENSGEDKTKGEDKTENTTEESTAENNTEEETSNGPDSSEQVTTGEEIPEETTVPEETAGISPAVTQYYEVQQGDTLYGICRKLYGNTNNIQIIMDLNNLESPDSITSGKKLIVP